MKRGFVVAIGGAAIVVAGLTGCGSDKAAAGSGKLSIDDKDQNIKGAVVCTDAAGNYSITIGETKQQGSNSGATALLSGDKKDVQSVSMVLNGQPLVYTKGAGGSAKVTADGKKYTVEGEALSSDAANHKFKMEITCP